MTKTALAVVFAIGFAVALLGTLPMRVALAWTDAGKAGLSARAVSGTIWNGRLEDATLHGVSLGRIDVRLDAFALLVGQRRLDLASREGRLTWIEGRTRGMERATLAFELAGIGAFPPGTVRLQDAAVLFRNGTCTEARGVIATDMFQRAFAGPDLIGDLACSGDEAVATLSGKSGGVRVDIQASLDASGRYRLRTNVAASDPVLRNGLLFAGFTESADTLARTDEGTLGS